MELNQTRLKPKIGLECSSAVVVMDSDAEIEVPLLERSFHPGLEPAPSEAATPRYGDGPGPQMGVESLDYDPIFSLVLSKTTKVKHRRHVYGYTGATLARWTITIAIGILVGIVAVLIESCQDLLVTRKKLLLQLTIPHSLIGSFLWFAAAGVLLVCLSSFLVMYWAPAAAGGGVTLVMAYLNGNDIPDFFQFRTLVTKVFGTICSISSGLLVGQEGPMVHIGAAISSLLTWPCGVFPLPSRGTEADGYRSDSSAFDFYNDKDRRDFISAGAAAGLAAAFGAPIGGVLYALEEASSFWSRKIMWRSLLCCTCANLVLALINEWEFSASLPGSMSFHGLQPVFRLRDLPLFALTSACAGILGAFINTAHGWLDKLRPPSKFKLARILEACLVVFVSVIIMFAMPLLFGRCIEVPEELKPNGHLDEDYWFRFTCPKDDGIKYYNDLATLLFSVPRQTMQELFTLGVSSKSAFTRTSLLVHSLSTLLLFIMAYGIATPGGIFMPSMLVGASLGALMGRIFEAILPRSGIQPGLHALIGATAMLGGVFRASISLVVIMVEGTGGIDFILPIITAIVVSNWVAHHVHYHGAYEADLERLGSVCFLQSEPPHELILVTAADIMSSNVVSFHEVTPVKEVVEVLKNTSHNGFPVLRSSPSGHEKFVGLILRHQLLVLLEQQAFTTLDSQRLNTRFSLYERQIPRELELLEKAMRLYHFFHNPHRRYLSSRPEAVPVPDSALDEAFDGGGGGGDTSNGPNGSNASPSSAQKPSSRVQALDLRPFMNRAPITVRRECSAHRVYVIFRTLGLRHLCVTDSHNRLIGIITRKDIADAQKHATMTKSRTTFHHWDSDARSFRRNDNNRERMFNLP